MGAVYQAWDKTNVDHLVALKVIHPHLSSDADFITRFRNAVRNTLELQTHPNIVKILDVDNDHGTECMIMEYFPSTNLRNHLLSHEKLDIRDAINLTSQIAQALLHAHSSNLLHLDIKPANILIDNNQQIKLTDFGMAKALSDAPLASTGKFLRSLNYMSPDQARHLQLDGMTDLYSLGIILHELVTGKNIWTSIPNLTIYSNLQAEHTIPALNIPQDVPQVVQEVIQDLLQFDRTDRIQNAQSLIARLEDIEPILSKSPVVTQMEDPDKTIFKPRGMKPEQPEDDTTEQIHQTPVMDSSEQDSSMPSKKSAKIQTSVDLPSTRKPFEEDPAAKAKDPAKPYYWVDDSHSFNQQGEEVKAKNALFLNQFPSSMSNTSHSSSHVKIVIAIGVIILLGMTLYWNQSMFTQSQPTPVELVMQEPKALETQQDKEHVDIAETQPAALPQEAEIGMDTQTTVRTQQTNIEPGILTTDLAQQDEAAAKAQANKRAEQAKATAETLAAERAQRAKAAAEALAAERAQQAKAAAEALAAKRTQQAKAAAEALVAERAQQAKAATKALAAKRAEQAKAATEVQAAKRTRKAKAATEVQAAKSTQQIKRDAVQEVERALQAKEEAYTQAVERTRQAQAAADQAAKRAQQAQSAADARTQQAKAVDAARSQETNTAIDAQKTKTLETQALMTMLERLRGSVAKKDLMALKQLSAMSESRYRMLKDLFSRYRTVEVSIGDVSRTPAKATAIFQITKLIRPNGIVVQPHPIVKNIKVTVLKNEKQWNLPMW